MIYAVYVDVGMIYMIQVRGSTAPPHGMGPQDQAPGSRFSCYLQQFRAPASNLNAICTTSEHQLLYIYGLFTLLTRDKYIHIYIYMTKNNTHIHRGEGGWRWAPRTMTMGGGEGEPRNLDQSYIYIYIHTHIYIYIYTCIYIYTHLHSNCRICICVCNCHLQIYENILKKHW